jgi:hypothetical protein
MRIASVLIVLVLFSAACFGQEAGDSSTVMSGCLVGLNGSFKLITSDGHRYVLRGSHSTLFSYNGMLVEVTGTVNTGKKPGLPTKPATLHVTKVKKLADTCQ